MISPSLFNHIGYFNISICSSALVAYLSRNLRFPGGKGTNKYNCTPSFAFLGHCPSSFCLTLHLHLLFPSHLASSFAPCLSLLLLPTLILQPTFSHTFLHSPYLQDILLLPVFSVAHEKYFLNMILLKSLTIFQK